MTESRANILNKIKQALVQKVPVPFLDSPANPNHFPASVKELELEFAENFTGLKGRFSYCFNRAELVNQLLVLIETRQWKNIYCREDSIKEMLAKNGFTLGYTEDLAHCDAALTGCEFLVARTGSMLLSSAQQSGRTTSVYAPVHICIAHPDQLVYDVQDAIMKLREKHGASFPSMVSLATGPSRTADIEKTLVVGVHGPKEVFCFLIDE
ncbi:MAG TPA: lactate utilization protein [Sediminibacterium sp.]|nr:lactate utilization protein [Sediminibacterium sp.]